ncbi:MAG TPA: MFS transporter [Candidatus Saccharimonadia bacterium]|nr:MFS transporter [Candidatus Saccharimonadia bacterium]
MDTAFTRTFASFKVRNFRLFYLGQSISLCGTWMQTVALSWLVLQMTHSGTQLGLVLAAQFLPILLFGVWGGVIADRFDKRHILYCTQTAAGLFALALGLLVVGHHIQLWEVYVLAACLGTATAIDNPTRQTFVIEMVGPEYLRNAVTLNSTLVNVARIVGPSIGGVLIATTGVGECFLFNAASYVAVLIALKAMRQSELRPARTQPRQPGQIKAGFRYVMGEPVLRATLLMMFIIGTFAYEFPVILPLFATITLHGSATTYSAMTACMGIGAVCGGLYTAGRGVVGIGVLVRVAAMFGFGLLLLSLAPGRLGAYIILVLVGALSVLFISLGNATLQLTSRPEMRGRVLSLWFIAFAGTTPVGGPIIGLIADHTNPRIGLATGAIATLLAAYLGMLVGKSHGRVKETD